MSRELSALGARYVLQDCEEALAELEREPSGAAWRIRWVAACTLLRTVGDVLESVDQQNTKKHPPELILAIKEHRSIFKKKEVEPGKYLSQIKEQTKKIIHFYDFQARQGVLVQLSDEINPETGIRIAEITGRTYDIVSGPFKGIDQRDFLRQAIKWWDEQLSEIEIIAAELKIKKQGWKINLKEQTATSINGMTFKLAEANGEYEGVCLNPKDIPPDDLDDEILTRMIKEAGVFYKMEEQRKN